MAVAPLLALAMLMSLATAVSAATAAPVPARVTFGIEPASATGPDGRPSFDVSATPGALVNDHVVAVNYSTAPLPLQIYATDGLETAGGGFGLLPGNVKPTSVGSWISFPSGAETVTVPPATASGPGTYVEPFVIRVPANAQPGDHVGGIVAQLQTIGTNSSGQRVILDQRIGTRVYVRISGPLKPKLVLTDQDASYQGTRNPIGTGRVKVSFVISNEGNVNLSLHHVTVSVSSLFGSSQQVQLHPIPLLLPGASVAESAVVPDVWPLLLIHVTESVIATTPSGQRIIGLSTVSLSSFVLAIPWGLVIIVFLVAAASVFLYRARSRKRAKVPEGEPEPEPVDS
jgi:hypothetical protein